MSTTPLHTRPSDLDRYAQLLRQEADFIASHALAMAEVAKQETARTTSWAERPTYIADRKEAAEDIEYALRRIRALTLLLAYGDSNSDQLADVYAGDARDLIEERLRVLDELRGEGIL